MEITQIIKRNGEIITLNTKEPFCVVKQATQNSSLMGDDYISLQIVSDKWLSFDKGDKIIVDGFDYSIRTTTTRGIEGANHYTFEPIFYGPMYDLMKTIYRNCDRYGKSDRSTFDLTYTIKEFVQVLIFNLNRDYPGLWAFDENNCPETEALTLQFSGNNCLQVLQTLCNKDNFNLEFLITQDDNVRTIHIGKFGQRVNPPGGAEYFEWGKGNGLYKLKEQKVDDKAIITRLWVEGGTTNIRTNYRNYAERLQLPCPPRYNRYRHILYDGTVVEPYTELIGISDDTKRYLEDAQLAAKIGSDEDSKTYDNIFPTRTGRVTALVDGDVNAFIDDTMDFNLNAKRNNSTIYLADGVTAKITFTSGLLAGQQFELEAKGGYDHTTKKFRIIPFTDKRGLTIPTTDTDAYRIRKHDTYKITDIFLPVNYEQRAEEELWYAGMNDFKPATQAKAQYSLTLDRLYFLEALSRDAEVCVFKVGDYVPVKDDRFGIEKQIRIQKITRNLLLEHDYQLTLSDTTAISVNTQTVLSVIDHERIINNNRLRDLYKARRGWRTTEDLRNMVYDTDGFFDTDNIRPNSIDTNMLTVGARSQQFVLSGVVLEPNADGNPNRFRASSGVLSHLTIADEIRNWQMSSLEVNIPITKGLYLFAKCAKSGDTGIWVMSGDAMRFEVDTDPDNYYFQVGILSSLYPTDNFRDFQTTYGFTRINGNTITTGRIITSDGECYLDLDGNKFRIGDATSSIDWNVSRDKAITLKNVSVVSESGDVSPLGVFRGVWDASYIYYPGDEVSYTDESGAMATYRYVHPTRTSGHRPTEDVYWNIVAKGADGKDGADGNNGADGMNGDYTEYRYATSDSKATYKVAFDPTKRNPGSSWATTMPSVGALQYLWLTTARINGANGTLRANWTTPIRVTPCDGEDGKPGKNGDAGPALLYRGVYDSSKTYVGTPQRVDCVKYNNHYYIAAVGAGSFSNILPTDTSRWNDFGAEFETIATNLLLAEGASIGDWFIKSGQIVSTMDSDNKNYIALEVGHYMGSSFVYHPRIVMEGVKAGGSHSLEPKIGARIILDATNGTIEAQATDGSYAGCYMSPTGIFANRAGTMPLDSTTGLFRRASIVGLGYADLKGDESGSLDMFNSIFNRSAVAGVYGRAYNTGTAPAYGGFFERLYAEGLVLRKRNVVCDTDNPTITLSSTDTVVLCSGMKKMGITTALKATVCLPASPYEGQTIFVKQWLNGETTFIASDGNVIYEENEQETSLTLTSGQCGIFLFTSAPMGQWQQSSLGGGYYTEPYNQIGAWVFCRFS